MCKQRKDRRGALQTLELLVVLPILILIVSAAFQFGLMFLGQQRLQMATFAAGRALSAGGHHGEQGDDYEHVSQQSLVQSTFTAALGEVAWLEACEVQVETIDEEAGLVRITTSVAANQVAPDMLAVFGLGLSDRRLTASIVTQGT